MERDLILKVLQANHWNRRKTAQVLAISYRALIYKIREAGLSQRHNRKGVTPGAPDGDYAAAIRRIHSQASLINTAALVPRHCRADRSTSSSLLPCPDSNPIGRTLATTRPRQWHHWDNTAGPASRQGRLNFKFRVYV